MTQSVLHQCNINQLQHLDCYSDLVLAQDAIIFYGDNTDKKNYNYLLGKFKSNKIYFLLSQNQKLSNINYSQWIQLVKNHSKTLTWH